jgi:hypothetical protein
VKISEKVHLVGFSTIVNKFSNLILKTLFALLKLFRSV